MGDGVESVGDGHDARRKRDLPSLQAAWIPRAVPAFVVCEDGPLQLRVEASERLQHVGATARVRGHSPALGRREALDVVNDVEQRFVDLADVVEERDTGDAATMVFRESGLVGEDERVLGDAANVDAGIGIVGIDGAKERFERGGGHAFGGLACVEAAPDEGGAEEGGSARGGDGGI